MKRYFLKDYTLFITAKILSWFFRILPMELALYLARGIGTIGYYVDKKHRKKVYVNIKIAFEKTKSLDEINRIVKMTFQNMCQHIVEVLCLPKISHGYIEKYVRFENKEILLDTINQKTAIILSSMHFGSWELSFIFADRLGPPFRIVAKEHTKYKKTDSLLNAYRQLRPGSVLYRGDNPREMIRIINDKEILGLIIDQGGKEGQLVEFLGKRASMPTGALRLALKYDVPIIISYIIRERGQFHKIILKKLAIEKTGDTEKDIAVNLKKITSLSEDIIRQYPDQYMWFYKVWKYSDEKKIVILNDGKMGHLRQSQAAAEVLSRELKNRNLKPQIEILNVSFKNKFSKALLVICSTPIGNRRDSGSLWYLRRFLEKSSYHSLSRVKADFVISCGSSLSNVNYILSNDNSAKSISILRPNLLSTNRFDLAIMPRHDSPAQRENVVITDGSLNLINDSYLESKSDKLISRYPSLRQNGKTKIGILLGGDTKKYNMSPEAIDVLISELKNISKQMDLEILITTSRRTPQNIEDSIKINLKDFPRCRLLVIANEGNIPEAVGGILGLSEIIIVSDDSISMVSEAASSGRNVIVVQTAKQDVSSRHKHRIFLKNLNNKKYVSLVNPENISVSIKEILSKRPKIEKVDDNYVVANAIKKIL